MIQELEENYHSLKEKVIPLRRNLERKKNEKVLNEKFTEGTMRLDKILSSQRPLRIKTSLGYSKTLEYSMGKKKFRSTRFEEPQRHGKRHHERINEDKRLEKKLGDR